VAEFVGIRAEMTRKGGAAQEEAKFDKLVRFAATLPAFREAMSEHMELEPMSPEWTCAVSVRLVNLGWFRVGEDRYAKAHKALGITTLQSRGVGRSQLATVLANTPGP
jgi:DNA topoisomerase-1